MEQTQTLYGADQWTDRHDDLLDHVATPPKSAPFSFIRTGLGAGWHVSSRRLRTAAKAAGFSRFEMGRNLTALNYPRPGLSARQEPGSRSSQW